MATISTQCNFKGNMTFEAEYGSHKVLMDAVPAHGGEDKGPSPKQMVLAGMCGCTGMDVVALLKKMRVEFKHFHIDAHTELTTDYPVVFGPIIMTYIFEGENLDQSKVIKGVTLSMSKYCGVSAMLSKNSPIQVIIKINNTEIYNQPAIFTTPQQPTTT